MDRSHHIIKILLRLGGILHKTGNRITEEFGITQQQFVLLTEVVEKKEVNQKQIVSELLLEKSNVSKIVKKLHGVDFISVSKSPYDMRTTILKPTPKGLQVHKACMEKLNTWNSACLEKLDEKKAREVHDALVTLQTHIIECKEK